MNADEARNRCTEARARAEGQRRGAARMLAETRALRGANAAADDARHQMLARTAQRAATGPPAPPR